MRNRFDEQLESLNNSLIRMGALCESAIANATKALLEGDRTLAGRAIEADSEIDQAEREVESLCLKLLLQQQPVARDLRQISSALKMITDMERIGDQASDISEMVMSVELDPAAHAIHIGDMARATIGMVTDSIDAYVRRDLALARRVIKADDVVDNLFLTVKSELLAGLKINPAEGEAPLDLLMIAKYYERIGDHATNIAEWVEFSITGVHKGELLG
ncbi:MAG: phosphate signaling complex protein PhoU [Oscillospiraceae bacterium]|mgnify:FL=1|nr:phosphate signaling complex protein PhoU [Oscillospiraceae bacterium]